MTMAIDQDSTYEILLRTTSNRNASTNASGTGWDGINSCYMPGETLRVGSGVRLDDEYESDLDPFEFEVISNALWTINEEHADTIKRVSGSPVVIYADDFNTSIQTELGEPVLFAPYIQYFTGCADLVVQWTLENRSTNPGIHDGDVFLQNDPLLGIAHEMDVQFFAPVFVDGRIFCWVFNSCHVRDIGGVEPGSFCAQALDVYAESSPLPPIKLVENGVLREDVEHSILRKSRVPDLLALEFRSQLAGIHAARERILELVERYGRPTVKGVMRKLIDDAQQTVAERLESLPDGVWRDVGYAGTSHTGDRGLHKVALTMEKRGDRLTFSNDGTDAQIGSWNCGYGVWRAAIGASLSAMLAWDRKFCLGGILGQVDFRTNSGTITCVDRNGSVSGSHGALYTIYQSGRLISKMLASSPELSRSVMTAGSVSTSVHTTMSGTDQWGRPYASATLDEVAGGLGAFSFRDGVDQGGAYFWPKSEGPDCEAWEQACPILYLFRRSYNGFGHGKYRGGAGLVLGWVGQGTDSQKVSAISSAGGVPVQVGMFGGHFGQSGTFYSAQDCGVRGDLEGGEVAGSLGELLERYHCDYVPAKTVGVRLHEDDVWVMTMYSGAGYGDPLARDPAAVVTDLGEGLVAETLIGPVYGVVLDRGGGFDPEGTAELRSRMLRERVVRAKAPAQQLSTADDGEPLLAIGPALLVLDHGGEPWYACSECRQLLSVASGNYKEGCASFDGSLVEIDPDVFPDPKLETDEDIVYRQYLCPGCGTAMEHELVRPGDQPVWDIELHLDGGA